MKKIYTLLASVIAILNMISCSSRGPATVTVESEAGDIISYQQAGYGNIVDYLQCKKDTSGNDGWFTYKVELDEPRTMVFTVKGKGRAVIRLSPGSCDTVRIGPEEVHFTGNNASYNRCLQAVDEYQKYYDAMRYGRHELDNASTPEQLQQILKPHQSRVLDILHTADVDDTFRKEQLAYEEIISRLIYIHAASRIAGEMTDEWKTVLKTNLSTPWNPAYLKDYRGLLNFENVATAKFLKLENGNPEDIENPYEFIFNQYGELLEGKGLEAVWANFIYDDIRNSRMTEEMLHLYDKFKQNFPDSPYMALLDEGMEMTRRFHHDEMDESIYRILPCDSTVRTLADAVRPFRGKMVYVDIWATWCGPCKAAFKHLPDLKEKTKEMDMIWLYISMDRPENADTWRKSITYYGLEGYHILSGKELENSIRKELGNVHGTLAIPRYLLVDRNGQILQFHAASPAEPDKLLEQIKTSVKNAVESAPTHNTIATYKAPCNSPALDISNNGAPILPDVAAKLFTPFFTTKPNGQGLGLTFIREVLTSHNCRFSLQTREDGETHFCVEFEEV